MAEEKTEMIELERFDEELMEKVMELKQRMAEMEPVGSNGLHNNWGSCNGDIVTKYPTSAQVEHAPENADILA